MMSSITIIIPAYNRSSLICRTLDSIKKQTYLDWECIVVDDHSSDNTKDVVSNYCHIDNRFKYVLNDRKKGAQGARNTGLYMSESKWIMFFDSDNFMRPELLCTLLDEAGDYDVCKCFSDIFDEETGKCIGQQDWIAEGDIHRTLFDGGTYVDYNQEIIKREKLLEIGGLDEDCPSLQEFDTNIRLSSVAKYHTVKLSLIEYSVGGKDTISGNYEKQVKGKLYNLKKYKADWLSDKENAARFIYEMLQKLQFVKPGWKRIRYLFSLFVSVPEMVPYYIKKHFRV